MKGIFLCVLQLRLWFVTSWGIGCKYFCVLHLFLWFVTVWWRGREMLMCAAFSVMVFFPEGSWKEIF